MTSSARLAKRDSRENVGWRIESSGMPPTCSIVRAPSRNSNSRGTMSTVTPASRHTRMACSRSSWLARVNAIITRSTRPKVIRSAQRVQRAEARDAEPAGLVDVVVDVADRVEAQLLVAVQPLHELERDLAGAEDQRALAQIRRAVQADARGGAPDPRAGAGDDRGAERADHGVRGAERGQEAEDGPRDQQRGDGEPRRVADAAGPRAQVVERVQAADVGEDRPAEADRERDHREDLDGQAGGERGDRTGDRTGDDVGRQQLAAQLSLSTPRRGLNRYERLSEDVRGDAQTSSRIRRCGIRAQDRFPALAKASCPGLLSINPRSPVFSRTFIQTINLRGFRSLNRPLCMCA